MSGRLGHIDGARRVGHVPVNGIRVTDYLYGFSGAQWHFSADKGVNSRTNGVAITEWVDLISSNKFIQNTGGSQPVYVSQNAAFNNYPSINFNTDAKKLTALERGLKWGTDTTIFTVAYINSINTINAILHTPGNFTRLVYGGNGNAAMTGIGVYNVYTPQIISTIENTNPHIVVITPTRLIIDGVQIATGTISGSPQLILNIGGEATIGFIGNIAELGAISGDLSQTNAIKLSDNINGKYAIY